MGLIKAVVVVAFVVIVAVASRDSDSLGKDSTFLPSEEQRRAFAASASDMGLDFLARRGRL